MWYRLENLPETEFNITYNDKQTLTTFCKVLKRCKPEWNLRVIDSFVNTLYIICLSPSCYLNVKTRMLRNYVNGSSI